jgi:hypothetical protein
VIVMNILANLVVVLVTASVYIVLRSFAVDDSSSIDKFCTGVVSALLTVSWFQSFRK